MMSRTSFIYKHRVMKNAIMEYDTFKTITQPIICCLCCNAEIPASIPTCFYEDFSHYNCKFL